MRAVRAHETQIRPKSVARNAKTTEGLAPNAILAEGARTKRKSNIENWGHGIEKIVAACDELGAPRPEYQVLGYGITQVLHALESAVIRDNMGTGSASDNSLTDGAGSEEFRSWFRRRLLTLTKYEESVYAPLSLQQKFATFAQQVDKLNLRRNRQ